MVAGIVNSVRTGGDRALRRLTLQYDEVDLDQWRVPVSAFTEAREQMPDELQRAIRLAADRIRAFYERQPKDGILYQERGSLLGQLVQPMSRIGCYVPGGAAPLFSTLLMLAVPARVAGVPDIVVATPPRSDGSVAREILAAAQEAGIDTVLRIGGAQAIAALAYGTETIPRVDKIVGPGNRFVVLAKRLVYGAVGIESLPGPTETLILADERADPHQVAADLLAQAEHPDAQPVLVTTSRELLNSVTEELTAQLDRLSTRQAARESIEERGFAVLVGDLSEGVQVANAYAPEHLCLLTRDPWRLLPAIRNAGGIFIGANSLEALGDYVAGPSHVMPTGATARFASAVNLRDFQKVIPLLDLSASHLAEIGPVAATLARAEGLEAHARAIESRLES